jgi:uncharacterized SAM-binding protein YcdF (DUF218 family)
MFYLKKVLTPFVLPPGIFIVLLMVAGIWRLYRRRGKSAAVALILAGLMWLSALTPVANLFLGSLEDRYGMPTAAAGDVIILLGGGINDRVPDMSGIGAPSDGMLARIVTAVRLHNRLGLPIIISGGKVYGSVSAEAPVVRRFLIDLGIDPQRIIVESRSRDTYENVKYTRQICKRHGFVRPILITTAYHMPRSVMLFEKAGLDVLPFPTGFKTAPDPHYGWQDFLPSGGAMRLLANAMHEYLGLLYYKLVL